MSWREDPIGAANRGEHPLAMARMRGGHAIFGEWQFLPGYCMLITDDPAVDHLTDLDRPGREAFLLDLTLIGEAVTEVCADRGLRRCNYEVLGNLSPWLHGHVHPRYEWEPPELVTQSVWRYPTEVREAPETAYSDARHSALRAALTAALRRRISER